VTDIVAELRQRHRNTTGLDPRITNPIVGPTIFLEAADEIERLRKERDEARREVCVARESLIRLMTHGDVVVSSEAMQHAAKCRGWDCFKENTDD